MLALRGFLSIVRWDLVLELRRREAVLNMTLFGALILFLGSYGTEARPELQAQAGPVIFWIAILFAGTVGLSRAFAVEREGGALTGILLSPLDPGVLYLAKVLSTWLYVMAMELVCLGAYLVLFQRPPQVLGNLPFLLAAMGAFTLAYVAAGAIIAAMTHGLRAGEVVLRILLFPILIPAVVNVLKAGERVFSPGGSAKAGAALGATLALAAVYLTAGFVLFPLVVEE